ncbi:MAG: hypothetical protein CME93_09235 [Hyphomonadaceae bacterium]|nr:hypothetical protein [Hyphomonadaceae bacterium]
MKGRALFRFIIAIGTFLLGLKLSYDGIAPTWVLVEQGSSLNDALFNPPTSAIRVAGALLVAFGGLVAIFSGRRGGGYALIGSLIIIGMALLIFATGADQSLWMNTVLEGFAALLLSILLLTVRRN